MTAADGGAGAAPARGTATTIAADGHTAATGGAMTTRGDGSATTADGATAGSAASAASGCGAAAAATTTGFAGHAAAAGDGRRGGARKQPGPQEVMEAPATQSGLGRPSSLWRAHRLSVPSSQTLPALLAVLALTAAASAVPPRAAAQPVAPSVPPAPAVAGPVTPPLWVRNVTRMAFVTPDQAEQAARAGAQVLQTNLIWPYYPLRRDGGDGPPAELAARLRALVTECRRLKVRLILGLPPFPPVELLRDHPEWRVYPTSPEAPPATAPAEHDLSTRLACNVGPWGEYLIDLCVELARDYGLDGFSFDGNYHPPICYCPACVAAYREERQEELPPRADLVLPGYRRYLEWRGAQLEMHYRRLRERLRLARPDVALISWSVNAGRYGHLLHSPRAMPTRVNLAFDMPMQEWWLDESNLGASVAAPFGVAYLRAVSGDRACAAEPYLMSRGNPHGTHSFPAHERLMRSYLAMTHGAIPAQSFGWPGHEASAGEALAAIGARAQWLTGTRSDPWAALLVSEQTRQFYAYPAIAEGYLPHLFGAYRALLAEHRPVTLINDWDLVPETLARYAVVVLPNAAALSDPQVRALRAYVEGGGGLVATGETSLFNEFGEPRRDFALADLFGVRFRGLGGAVDGEGRPRATPESLGAAGTAAYFRERQALALLGWPEARHPLLVDAKLSGLVPTRSVVFRGPAVRVSEPEDPSEVVARMLADGERGEGAPAVLARRYGRGRVVYFPAGLDAANWSSSLPYHRRMLDRALHWAAQGIPAVQVEAPQCVQAGYYVQPEQGNRKIIHLLNNLNSAAGQGLPVAEVPLREESVPVHGVRVRFRGRAPVRVQWQPGSVALRLQREGEDSVVEVPPLPDHMLIVAEYAPPAEPRGGTRATGSGPGAAGSEAPRTPGAAASGGPATTRAKPRKPADGTRPVDGRAQPPERRTTPGERDRRPSRRPAGPGRSTGQTPGAGGSSRSASVSGAGSARPTQ